MHRLAGDALGRPAARLALLVIDPQQAFELMERDGVSLFAGVPEALDVVVPGTGSIPGPG